MVAEKATASGLGFAVLAKFFEHEGRFLAGTDEVPVEVVVDLARQVGVPWELWRRYRRRLLLCLYASGTNTGIRRIAAGEHGESEWDIRYVRRRYLTPADVRRAISVVVNATLAAREQHHWGEATTTASDSTKIGAWDHNLLAEWHVRYRGPGVMIYWHARRKPPAGGS